MKNKKIIYITIMILLVGIVLFSQKDYLNGNLTGYAVKSTNLKEVDAFTVIKPDERVFQEFSSLNIDASEPIVGNRYIKNGKETELVVVSIVGNKETNIASITDSYLWNTS